MARLHLGLLEDQSTRDGLITALDRLPQDLNDTYSSAMDRIRDQRGDSADYAYRALKWITFSKVALEPKELQHALAVRPDSTDVKLNDDSLIEISKLISLCAGLIILDDGCIRLVHYTAQEFLQRDPLKDANSINLEIAMTCLRYFSLPAFSQNFRDAYELRSFLGEYSLSTYGVRHWFQHVPSKLEEESHSAIFQTFGNRAYPRSNSVLQIVACLDHNENEIQFEDPPNPSLFILAAMWGLTSLCKKIWGKKYRPKLDGCLLWS